MIEIILNDVRAWLNFFFQQAINSFTPILSDLRFFLINELQRVIDFTQAQLDSAFAIIAGLNDKIVAAVETLASGARGLLEAAIDELVLLSVGAIDQIRTAASSFLTKIQGLIDSSVRTIADLASKLTISVQASVTSTLAAVKSLADQAVKGASDFVSSLLADVKKLIDSTTAALNTGIQKLVGTADSLVKSIETRLSDLRKAFAEAAASLVKGLTEKADDLFEPVRDSIVSVVEDLAVFAEPREVSTMLADINRLTSSKADPVELRNWLDGNWRRFAPEKGILATILFTLISIVGQVMLFIDASRINSQIMLQGMALQFPYQLLTPADASHAFRRGFISEAEAINVIRRQGYAEPLARTILSLTEQFPPEQEIMALWHRGLLSEAHVDQALKAQNRTAEFIKAQKEGSFPLPPIGDLITMAVREVFTPGLAESFGLFEDFPEAFAKEAEKQGLTREWATRYWGAHWALPSPQQGFEMLHRGAIGPEKLQELLRALDVMPGWRKPLTDIAFNPYTRVDIRRMHQLGVLDDDDVFIAHLELGYDTEKADKLTQFVLRLNRDKSADDDVELGKLSRTVILGFFSDGLITRDRAKELLQGLGFTPEASELFVETEELEEERRQRKIRTATIVELAGKGILTFEEATDRLNQLGLSTVEVEKAVAQILEEQERKLKLPTKAEAAELFRARIIGQSEFDAVLIAIGYPEKWRKAFIQLEVAKLAAVSQPAKA